MNKNIKLLLVAFFIMLGVLFNPIRTHAIEGDDHSGHDHVFLSNVAGDDVISSSISRGFNNNVIRPTDFTVDITDKNNGQNKVISWGVMTVNGIPAYCLEPYVDLEKSKGYGVTDVFNKLSPKMQNDLWTISYFGYGFEGDKSNERYLATQKMIWEMVPNNLIKGTGKGYTVNWWGQDSFKAKIASKEAEIKELIKTIHLRPSLNNTTIEGKLNETITIKDTNKVLDRFNIVVGNGVQVVSKKSDTLQIKITSRNFNPTVSFTKKYQPSEQSTYVWEAGVGQRILTMGKDRFDPLNGKFNLKLSEGTIDLEKRDADGRLVQGVSYEFSKDAKMNSILFTLTTDKNGKSIRPNVESGKYYYREKSTRPHLLLDTTIRSIDVKTSAVSTIRMVNKYSPIAKLGLNKLRVDTKKSKEGLVIEAWLDKVQNYDWTLNSFGNTPITIELRDKKTNALIATQTSPVNKLEEHISFTDKSPNLMPGMVKDYTVVIKSSDENKVQISEKKSIDIEGYTATEGVLKYNVNQHGHDVHVKKVVRTERAFGKSIEYWYETFTMKIPKINKLRTGRSFEYLIQAEYLSDLGFKDNFTITLKTDSDVLDGFGQEYNLVDSSVLMSMEKNGNVFSPPVMYGEKNIESKIITLSEYEKLRSSEKDNYRRVEGRLTTSMWDAELGTYPLVSTTSYLGVHSISIEVENTIETYAFLFGWLQGKGVSPTISDDEIIISPIITSDNNGNKIPDSWEEFMPNNWGQIKSGKKELNEAEREFLGY